MNLSKERYLSDLNVGHIYFKTHGVLEAILNVQAPSGAVDILRFQKDEEGTLRGVLLNGRFVHAGETVELIGHLGKQNLAALPEVDELARRLTPLFEETFSESVPTSPAQRLTLADLEIGEDYYETELPRGAVFERLGDIGPLVVTTRGEEARDYRFALVELRDDRPWLAKVVGKRELPPSCTPNRVVHAVKVEIDKHRKRPEPGTWLDLEELVDGDVFCYADQGWIDWEAAVHRVKFTSPSFGEAKVQNRQTGFGHRHFVASLHDRTFVIYLGTTGVPKDSWDNEQNILDSIEHIIEAHAATLPAEESAEETFAAENEAAAPEAENSPTSVLRASLKTGSLYWLTSDKLLLLVLSRGQRYHTLESVAGLRMLPSGRVSAFTLGEVTWITDTTVELVGQLSEAELADVFRDGALSEEGIARVMPRYFGVEPEEAEEPADEPAFETYEQLRERCLEELDEEELSEQFELMVEQLTHSVVKETIASFASWFKDKVRRGAEKHPEGIEVVGYYEGEEITAIQADVRFAEQVQRRAVETLVDLGYPYVRSETNGEEATLTIWFAYTG